MGAVISPRADRGGRNGRVRAVLLDWGGTLVSRPAEPLATYDEVLARHGISVRRSALARGVRLANRQLWPGVYSYLGRSDEFWRELPRRALIGAGIPDPTPDLCEALRIAFRSPRWYRPYPECAAVLSTLRRRGLRLHIISNNTDDLSRIVADLGWGRRFDSVTCSQEAGAAKPDPRIFALAVDRTGYRPAELVHVGDSVRDDVDGARAYGIPTVWMNRDGRPARKNRPMITDLRELLALLDEPDGRIERG
jgi:putative hydrolase of the HAD superfamily